ncbi:glutathione transferase GST 23-like [Andrographis paniculata]|uniref:glutathione transferase GST 23-like n=1 Tax=Andrographis paniculata TaxID=175694 RepID=UPI0021E8ABD9|nr:glutathione transferase GST 23-like [Andrographis paniculata]
MAESHENLKLFRTWSSPYAMRAVQALKIKGLEYDAVFEDINNKSTSLLQYNPVHRKVPVLLHNGRPVCESLIILEYIDDTWNQPHPLLPHDPYQKAIARFWAKFGDDKLLPSVWRVFVAQGEEQREAAVAEAAGNLKLVEEQLKGKEFFGGERIGYLDIALGWMGNLVGILDEIAGIQLVTGEAFPELSAWIDRFAGHPAIKELWPPHDRMVDKFKAMREPHVKKSQHLVN